MDRHAQLGVYQEAINSGHHQDRRGPGDLDAHAFGAELVFLRKSARTVREQSALEVDENPEWARELIDDVSGRMRAASFPARVEPQKCRVLPRPIIVPGDRSEDVGGELMRFTAERLAELTAADPAQAFPPSPEQKVIIEADPHSR
jgi:hypothetical protein